MGEFLIKFPPKYGHVRYGYNEWQAFFFFGRYPNGMVDLADITII